MKVKGHISEVSSARFVAAMTAALSRLESAGEPFLTSDVIRDARYEDGSSVGETTIYAKGIDGKRIHADLLTKIKESSSRSQKKKKCSKSIDLVADAGNAAGVMAMRRQLIEQEGRCQELESAVAALTHQMRRAQEESYVVLATLNQLTKGAVLDVARPLRELEGVIGQRDLVAKLKDSASLLASQCQRLLRPL